MKSCCDVVKWGALKHPELRLLQPIPLRISRDMRGCIASWDEIDEFGIGEDASDAMKDFGESITELYVYLHHPGILLSDYLEDIKRLLDKYIEPRRVRDTTE